LIAYEEIKNAIEQADAISILTHLNPDADTLGTGLGIYTLLTQEKGKRVEIVNASSSLPRQLDFLKNFKKIKNKIEYDDSLIITCDCGNLERLGFDMSGRKIINIDHHNSNTYYGDINIVASEYASTSQVAFELFQQFKTIDSESATCFYTALLSDTQYFTSSSVSAKVFDVAKSLIDLGTNPAEVAYHLKQRKPLSALRILEKSLATLTLHAEAKIATILIIKEDIEATGASISDMEGIVDYAKSLATVEIAICAMETPVGIRVSLRSTQIDISKLALEFGGGGHKIAAGFTLKQCGLQETIDTILKKIQNLGLING
jgi:phosphoesterase RecJ-like protein